MIPRLTGPAIDQVLSARGINALIITALAIFGAIDLEAAKGFVRFEKVSFSFVIGEECCGL